MIPLDAFSPDYAAARARFRSLMTERGWHHEAIPIEAPGYKRGQLTIDLGRVGPANAERLLVLSSGLHGTEGFFGSAAQVAWIESLPRSWEPPAGCAVLLVHALNPHGFAEVSRVNEDRVDLNRNFLAPEEFVRLREITAERYGPLDPYLNPPYPPGRLDYFGPLFAWMVLRFGYSTVREVMPAGQYAFPRGIFYGGKQTCQTTRIMMNETPRWLGDASFIIHLDFHTGLGRFGQLNLLSSEAPDSARLEHTRRLFGDRVIPDQAVGGGYHNFGDMGEWLGRRFADRAYLYLCAEFGTFGSTRVIGALRRENQLRHHSIKGQSAPDWMRQEMREVFCPSSSAWRWSVVHQSVHLIQDALMICAEPCRFNTQMG